mmetsp:Transcript_21386/g.52642  ORF Transcript_21386/g.52642 Transcript_21386/m.52642 type:complete len:225 (-) Transcript_21386:53-727(-)
MPEATTPLAGERPPRPPFDAEKFFGEELLIKPKVTKSTAELLKDKELIALYFSASWCPPCRQFSPWLKQFYETHAKSAKLEIIYVSSDKTIPSFEDYYKTMPWLAVPGEKGSAAIKQRLANTFGIMGIPALMIMDAKTGQFISGSGREDVSNANNDTAKGKAVIEQWKSAERKPLSEAAGAVGGSGGLLMSILMYFARNPMFLFGLLYLYKWGKKQIMGEGQEL